MARHKPIIAVFPGTFDPITYGHLDVIKRASRLFDELIVAVGRNPDKPEIFTQAERVELICPLVAKLPNVRVEAYEGLTFDFVRSHGAKVILRGIRDTVDLRSELHQANTNLLVGDVETVFMLTTHDHALTSSTLIRQIVSLGGPDRSRAARLVPPSVASALRRKLRSNGPTSVPAADQPSRASSTSRRSARPRKTGRSASR